jgi:FixJ family two-component response regulator
MTAGDMTKPVCFFDTEVTWMLTNCSSVRLMLLTGCGESVATKMLKNGLGGFLQKPFDLSDLDQKVWDAINAPEVSYSPSPD